MSAVRAPEQPAVKFWLPSSTTRLRHALLAGPHMVPAASAEDHRGDMAEYTEILRKLALNDRGFVDTVLGMGHDTVEVSCLDPKTHALIRLAASLAVDAGPSSYQSSIEVALAAGAQVDEIVGTLIAVAPIIGLARVVSDAPELALALGYDVEAALEAQGDGAT